MEKTQQVHQLPIEHSEQWIQEGSEFRKAKVQSDVRNNDDS